ELGDDGWESVVLNNIAGLYNNQKEYNKAIEYANKSLKISQITGELEGQKQAFENLTASYKGLNDYKNAFESFEMLTQIHDTLYSAEKHNQFVQMEAIYQNEKQQKEIELLNKEKEKQTAIADAEYRKQRAIIYSILCVLLLVIIFSFIVYRSFLAKRKANILLAKQKIEILEKNEELNQQNDEIAAQRDEIEAQRDLVINQKNHIEEIHDELTDSIQYAKRIQNAVLPTIENISDRLNLNLKIDFFILFKPRDIVSGDFYFFEKRKEYLLLAVSDCTGHGVPGAFMSMLGISFLQEIIAKEGIKTAAGVLNELREYVIKSLQQKGIRGEQKDGMDITFVVLNTESNELQFSGANNPLFIISGANKEMIEIKPDKMPVSIYENMNPFTNHIIQLKTEDIFYLLTDGYQDQFGGPKGKKFMKKQLKQLIADNCDKPMAEQKDCLDQLIQDWKDNYEIKYKQTDDITIMGVKVS
ncbi:MAG: SpoIIE family protein phosphatase, partial [Bacteroidota bacterium]